MSVHFLVRFFQTRNLLPFAIYCLLAADLDHPVRLRCAGTTQLELGALPFELDLFDPTSDDRCVGPGLESPAVLVELGVTLSDPSGRHGSGFCGGIGLEARLDCQTGVVDTFVGEQSADPLIERRGGWTPSWSVFLRVASV